MKVRSLLKFAVAATALAFTAVASAQNYKSEYKMSLVVGTAFPWGKGGEIWANMVKERTNGRINIKLYPGVSLVQGDQTREFTAIRQGVIDGAYWLREPGPNCEVVIAYQGTVATEAIAAQKDLGAKS